MPREVVFVRPRQVEVRDYQDRVPGPREVKVKVLYSGISHGTERSHYRGDAIWHHKRVDPDGFVTEGQSWPYPFTYGYEDVAQVVEVGSGVTEVEVGDVVSCMAHHRESRVFDLDYAKAGARKTMGTHGVPTDISLPPLPPGSCLEKYIFVALGTVALDALLVSGLRLGESSVIIGQGVVGLLMMQLCKLAGAEPVIAVDYLDVALYLGGKVSAQQQGGISQDTGQRVVELMGDA